MSDPKLNMNEFFDTMEEFLTLLDKKVAAKKAKEAEEKKKEEPEEEMEETDEEPLSHIDGLTFTEALSTLYDDYQVHGDKSELIGIRNESEVEIIAICHADEAPNNFYLIKAGTTDEGDIIPSTVRPYTITNDDIFSMEDWELVFKTEE